MDDRLFATPSFVRGLARTFDFWGDIDIYNWDQSPECADAVGLFEDFSLAMHEVLEA